MSYVVLARKYRPRSFDQMVGQEHVVRALTNALEQQRLHHAYLFTGPGGSGLSDAALAFAAALTAAKIEIPVPISNPPTTPQGWVCAKWSKSQPRPTPPPQSPCSSGRVAPPRIYYTYCSPIRNQKRALYPVLWIRI